MSIAAEKSSGRANPRRTVRALLLLGAAALLLAALPARAAALGASTYDPLASGQTRLSFEKSFLALLKQNGVHLAASAPAKLKAGAVTLPVNGGEYDPTIEKGTITHEGVLRFVAGPRSVPLRDLMLKIKPAPLYAKVGGGQLKLAGGAKTEVSRAGFGAHFTATRLRLTSKFATRLNKKLRLKGRPLKPGMALAKLSSTVQPQSVNVLDQGKMTLAPDPGVLAKLHELHVSLNPVFPAELAAGPLFSLPLVVTGRISPDGRSGTIKTDGSIEFLQLGAGQVFWHAFWFELGLASALAEADVEPTPAFPGKLGQIPVTSFDLSTATIASNPRPRTVAISGARLELTPQSAATFNEAFAKPQERSDVFHAGELFATVSFTARGQ